MIRKSSSLLNSFAPRAPTLLTRTQRTVGPTVARDSTSGLFASHSRPNPKASLFIARRNFISSMSPSQPNRKEEEEEVIPNSPIPILTSVREVREWRQKAIMQNKSVGFVPTMGALHNGHLNLVRQSLKENDLTIVSIFVNPAQFAPSEDLDSYPRTLPSDTKALSELSSNPSSVSSSLDSSTAASASESVEPSTQTRARKVSAIWAPKVSDMYPNGFTQIVEDQVGAFVEIKGLDREMEGKSRPGFFRGVATVVTKLFHVVQPTLAYFGQKDIQQAIILRRLVSDLLFTYPASSSHVRVLPTTRDPKDQVALSSRNAYLSEKSRSQADVLIQALNSCRQVWQDEMREEGIPIEKSREIIGKVLKVGRDFIKGKADECRKLGLELELDYISLNEPLALKDVETLHEEEIDLKKGLILSGAVFIRDTQQQDARKVRLIDNLLLGFQL